MTRTSVILLAILACAAATLAQDAPADSATAAADTTAAGRDEALIGEVTTSPSGGIQAEVQKVRRYAGINSVLKLSHSGEVTGRADYGFENYRKQDKTVETRTGAFKYGSGSQLPVSFGLDGDWSWSEDITINTAGLYNLNKRDSRNAGLTLSRTGLVAAGVKNDLFVTGKISDQKAENQRQRNDLSEASFDGALRSKGAVAEGLNVATRLYGVKRNGESMLGTLSSPSSTTGDTLGAGVYWDRSRLKGKVVVSQSSFDRRYLDFNRNESGLIDTSTVKVVQQLEERDALTFDCENTLDLGRFDLTGKLSHEVGTENYRFSGLSHKERLRDAADIKFSAPVWQDSVVVTYKYEWTWDDQTLRGARTARGRQYSKTRELLVDWRHPLFANTRLVGLFGSGLDQETAQNKFNDNDRDRVTGDASLKVETNWTGFHSSVLFEYRSTEDISLRANRSANNNRKQTYEIAPSYGWQVANWLNVSQVFRLYIQYQDYVYGALPTVNKDDNYNKRGNLTTTVKLDPNDRIAIVLGYDHGSRFNATETLTDAVGHAFYRRDQEQFTSRIDMSLKYKLCGWMSLDAATFRAKDRAQFSGTTARRTETYSGEIWIGTTVNKSWGKTNPLILSARVKKFQAFGPNVTETNRDYWDADVSLKWSF